MNPSEIIQSVQDEHPQKGWVIYRYNLTWALLGLLMRLFYFGILAGGTAIFFISSESNNRRVHQLNTEEYFYAGVFAIGALIALYYLLKHLYFLLNHNRNMIVLTDRAIIKSWGRTIQEFVYSDIDQMKIVRIQGRNRPYTVFPEHYIEFMDKQSGKIVQLARNRIFGRADEIYTMLQTKF